MYERFCLYVTPPLVELQEYCRLPKKRERWSSLRSGVLKLFTSSWSLSSGHISWAEPAPAKRSDAAATGAKRRPNMLAPARWAAPTGHYAHPNYPLPAFLLAL